MASDLSPEADSPEESSDWTLVRSSMYGDPSNLSILPDRGRPCVTPERTRKGSVLQLFCKHQVTIGTERLPQHPDHTLMETRSEAFPGGD